MHTQTALLLYFKNVDAVKGFGKSVFPCNCLACEPPKTVALPSVVLSPRSPNDSNVGPLLPFSPDKMCVGNNLSSPHQSLHENIDRVHPLSPNSVLSAALNCLDPSQCASKDPSNSSTPCTGLGTIDTKPGFAVC
ncbi:hypothetical protein HNY73_001554 [Argiope bruennichi]|uniref:Uncharacterized protein n=1 Tax=Argiope bruennichi TaxID=94029 RepID=A0A8T0G5V6_ARGBR|nr:hypothetical protein HNY73_001554 [Argiope bruennichi]